MYDTQRLSNTPTVLSGSNSYPWDPNVPLLCVDSRDLASKGLSLRLCSQANTLNGIKLSNEINPQDENSIGVYPN